MIRDYGQAASDLKKYMFIVENQSDDKVTLSRSAGSVELKKARRNKPLMEEAAKKEISLDFYLILWVFAFRQFFYFLVHSIYRLPLALFDVIFLMHLIQLSEGSMI